MSDEPEYLKALRRTREQQKQGGPKQPAASGAKAPSPAEREALRWAKEVGGKDIRVVGSLSGAKVAILVQPITPFGKPPVSLEGLASREAFRAGRMPRKHYAASPSSTSGWNVTAALYRLRATDSPALRTPCLGVRVKPDC